MSLFKNIILGAAATKLFAKSNQPIIIAPSGYSVIALRHIGFGNSWEVTYAKNEQLNVQHTCKINKSTRSFNVHGKRFTVNWP